MIKQKAPKDMTAVEFVEYLIARKEDEKVLDVNVYYTLEFLKGRLNEPAPNPFTPDQLATMRELQRNGYCYASMDKCTGVYLYQSKPEKEKYGYWDCNGEMIEAYYEFLGNALSWDDPEPLCFADYAPLEEKK